VLLLIGSCDELSGASLLLVIEKILLPVMEIFFVIVFLKCVMNYFSNPVIGYLKNLVTRYGNFFAIVFLKCVMSYFSNPVIGYLKNLVIVMEIFL